MFRNFGRREPRIFAVEQDSMATPAVKEQFRQDVASVDVRFTTLTPKTPDRHKRKRGIDPVSGLTFVELLSTTSGKVYIQESPERANKPAAGEVLFHGIPCLAELRETDPDLFKSPITSDFHFEVTKQDIDARIGVKRPRTQNQVVGCSAKEVFEAYGAIISEEIDKVTRRIPYHHAHRQAWCLAGDQIKENMDPATAGSNYTTLFTIEAPLKSLLTEENIVSMRVKGTVIYHPLVPFPMQITYSLSWGNHREAEIKIYPLEHRSPTISEFTVAKAMFKAVRSPELDGESKAASMPSFFNASHATGEADPCAKNLFPDDAEEQDDMVKPGFT